MKFENLNILFVEDEENDFTLATKILEKANISFSALQVRDRKSFLEVVSPRFDLVIVDYVLDGFSGIEVVEYMKKHFPEIPVILVSGRMGEQLVVDTMKAGAFDYVMKDRLTLLASAVERAVLYLKSKESLKQAERELAETQRLETLGLISASLANDFNNILASLSLGLDKVKNKTNMPPEMNYYFENFGHNLKLATMLTQQLLNLAKKKEAQSEIVNVQKVIQQIFPLLKRFTQYKALLEVVCEEPYLVSMPSGHLEQILFNLVINSVHALDKDQSKIVIEVQRNNQRIEISVRDNGIGIPFEIQEKVFSPFFTTKGNKSTGLGLASVRRIVDANRGSLKLESQSGQGTAVHLILPEAQIPAVRINAIQNLEQKIEIAPQSPTLAEKPRVFIIEDEEFLRQILVEFFASAGFQAAEVRADFQQLEKNVLNTDFFIIDANLPGVDGIELAQRIQSKNPKTKIILISGFFTDQQEETLQRLGLSYLQKPFELNLLLANMISDVQPKII